MPEHTVAERKKASAKERKEKREKIKEELEEKGIFKELKKKKRMAKFGKRMKGSK